MRKLARSGLRTASRAAAGSLREQVYNLLRKDIITGVYKPGEALREEVLAERYETSRTPVREAASRLERDQLLRFVPNKGYFVRHITVTELNELYEYRSIIECAAAELAARKEPDPELLAQLKELSEVRYRPEDRRSYIRFIEADTAFHIGIARMARNELLVRASTDLRCSIERLLYAGLDLGNYATGLTQEHREIYDAIRNRDEPRAREVMMRHVLGSKSKVFSLL
ncbi:MAG: GntR family transcriptional regulator [Acidobacteria bacterium]|nr:GntR family transcriptional regulator [Acidobacteriota bacterium]MCW5970719.1 GntR family transcriptional regulator [Blastocatellales bacterium]